MEEEAKEEGGEEEDLEEKDMHKEDNQNCVTKFVLQLWTMYCNTVNHRLTLREAGLRVQPNLSRYTVASIVRTFRQDLYLHFL